MSELLSDLAPPIRAKLDQAEARMGDLVKREQEIKEEQKQAREDVRILQTILARVNGEPPPGAKPRPKKSKASVSDKRVEEVYEAIKALGKPSVDEIAAHMGVTTGSSIRTAIVRLREDERVRDAGRRERTNGTKGVGPREYAVMG